MKRALLGLFAVLPLGQALAAEIPLYPTGPSEDSAFLRFFNAGEKLWFWIGVFLLTIVVSVTGLILDFPNFGQGREAMQLANVIHAIGALLYMAFGLGHIYLGTIGVQGAYHSMRYDGMVDEAWAKAHHEYWYEEVKAQQKGSVQAAGAVGGGEPQRA
ncbi:MAG: hypothetical protein DI596_05220 [Azospira oryzae]|nr:MAG: hypothetical protein DI596_05220 [Azospira oryzae]PZP80987.1 MAG: hypothetical protein DI593_05220 [Azospira oryzae]